VRLPTLLPRPWPRMSMEQLELPHHRERHSQVVQTKLDNAGQFRSCYGSEGWGSSPSERATVSPGHSPRPLSSRIVVHIIWPDSGRIS